MLEILKYPDERLKLLSAPVLKFDADLHKLLDDLAIAMYGANGVGLAAPQVNRHLRIFVIDIGGGEENRPRKLYEFINPKISDGTGKILFEEGCLSIPGISEEVQRKAKIKVAYVNRKGEPQTMEADDLLAVAIQHENDHLDGVLFVDRLSPLKRKLLKRKLSKVQIL